MPRSNILTDTLPDKILCGGKEFAIKTDFRAWLQFGKLLEKAANSQSDIDKMLFEAISCVMVFQKGDSLAGTLLELVGELFEFYSGNTKKHNTKDKKKSKNTRAIYDFYEDADYIFASFFEVYGIDLTSCTLHWHKFLALFRTLPENCKFSKILSYRSCDTSKMKGEEKRFYTEMKEFYALPDNRSREEKDAELYAEIAALI